MPHEKRAIIAQDPLSWQSPLYCTFQILRAFFRSSEKSLTQLYFYIVWENICSGSINSTENQNAIVFQKHFSKDPAQIKVTKHSTPGMHLRLLIGHLFLNIFFKFSLLFSMCSWFALKEQLATFFSMLHIGFPQDLQLFLTETWHIHLKENICEWLVRWTPQS